MHSNGTADRSGVVVADGYGIKVYVRCGHLLVEDGIGRQRHTRRYNRVTGGLKRLVVCGHDGFITLGAMRWLRDVGAAFVQLDRDGQLVCLSAAHGPTLPKLRRAQAVARDNANGVEIARLLLGEKVRGQASVAAYLSSDAEATIGGALAAIDNAVSIAEMVAAEAAAANAYWDAWAPLPVRFSKRELARIPEHWLVFGQRHSPLTRSPRLAVNPANAILNYLYALLEAETTIAIQAAGLDPAVGVVHTDKPARASLALDVMEAGRPHVDAYLLDLLRERTFGRDFAETPKGGCRILANLSRHLATTTTAWRDRITPVVEVLVQQLALDTGQPVATRLTGVNRAAAWTVRRGTTPIPRRIARPQLPATCRTCGTQLRDRRRRECADCKRQRAAQSAVAGRQAATDVLARLREAGQDPAHGGRAAVARGAKNAAHQRAVQAWTGERPDPEVFRSQILPGLRGRRIGDLVDVTGLSEHYCSLIRLGKRTPHPRHWQALGSLATTDH